MLYPLLLVRFHLLASGSFSRRGREVSVAFRPWLHSHEVNSVPFDILRLPFPIEECDTIRRTMTLSWF